LTSPEENVRPELLRLNINIPLSNPPDLFRIRHRSATNTPLSPHPTSPPKQLPAPRSYLPQDTITCLYGALSPTSNKTRGMSTFRDIDKDQECDDSIAQIVLQYTTQSMTSKKKIRVAIETFPIALLVARPRTFDLAIQQTFPSPIRGTSPRPPESGAQPPRPPSRLDSLPRSRPISESPTQSRHPFSHSYLTRP
jgi:hypothetical protein